MSRNNVIKFPIDRTRGPLRRMLSFDQDNIRVVIAAALVTVLVAVPTLNSSIFSRSEATNSSGRGIASVSRNVQSEREKLENDVIKQLSALKGIVDVQVGQKPARQEALRYEGLEGKYVVEFENGKIVSAKLRSDASHGTSITDDLAFLKKYAEVFPGNLAAAEKVSETISGSTKKIAYRLPSDSQTSLVELDKDESGNLIQLQIREEK